MDFKREVFRAQGLTPVVPATWEMEIGRICDPGKQCETIAEE
jgi:hypothetical protein